MCWNEHPGQGPEAWTKPRAQEMKDTKPEQSQHVSLEMCTEPAPSSAQRLLWGLVAPERRARWVGASEGVWGGRSTWSRGFVELCSGPALPQNLASANAAASKPTHDEGAQTWPWRARHQSRAWLPSHSGARARPAKPRTSMSLSQRERWQPPQPGRGAHRA